MSWTVALYMVYRAAYCGWQIGYYSRGLDEATVQLSDRVLYIADRLPGCPAPTVRNATRLVWASGGSIDAHPATKASGVGQTYQLVVADELAFHAYGGQNYDTYRPTLSAGGQYIALSTADPDMGPYGFFHDLWGQAERGEVPYQPRFIGRWARPDQGAEWWATEQAAFAGRPEALNAAYPERPEDAFTGREGLVYGASYDSARNVAMPARTWEQCQWRAFGIDPGGGDPTAVIMLGAWLDASSIPTMTVYGEYVDKTGTATVESIAAYLGGWHRRAKIDFGVIDTAGGTVLLNSLQALGYATYPADKDRRAGIDEQAGLLASGHLTIDPACIESIAEFGGYRWAQRVDPTGRDRYDTSTPVDHHADCLVAGTLITTVDGQVPIERIRAGDLVLTRAGYRPVLAAWLASPADETWLVRFSDGTSLTGTADHPVWTEPVGWVHLSALRHGDIVSPCNRSTATTTARPDVAATGTRHGGKTAVRCTATFGNSSTGPFSPAMPSTTSITIPTTTISGTSWRSPDPNILVTTAACEPLSRSRPSWPPPIGIVPSRAVHGIKRTASAPTRHGRWCSTCASGVGKPSSPAPVDGCTSVQTVAGHATYVLGVERTGRREPVFDVMVDGHHEFYANGVLVHNCHDARRYVCRAMLAALAVMAARTGRADRKVVVTGDVDRESPEQRVLARIRRSRGVARGSQRR